MNAVATCTHCGPIFSFSNRAIHCFHSLQVIRIDGSWLRSSMLRLLEAKEMSVAISLLMK